MLKDNYQRNINYLRISLTDRCNLRCQYCMPEEGIPLIHHRDILTYEEILRLVKVYAEAGISKVRITGGEPLVRKGVVDLIAQISQIPGIADLSMTTNAVLLQGFVPDLKKAGLKRINISLDTLDPAKFQLITRRDKFHQVWAGIEESLRAGFHPVKLNVVTINGTNHTEVVDFAALSLKVPLSIRFIEYMPTGCDQWSPDLVIEASRIKEIIEAELGTLIPVSNTSHQGPAVCYRFQDSPGEIGFINPVSSHFCDTCNRIRLTPDGHLRTCLFSDDETDLKPYLRSNCSDEVLLEVLHQTLAAKPRRHLLETVQFKKCQRTMSAIGG